MSSSPAAFGAMLYYLIHSTLVCGGLFLLADLVSRGRGELADRLEAGPSPVGRGVLGALFFAGAIAVVGLPLLYAEMIIGRRGGSDAVGSMLHLTRATGGAGKVVSWATGLMAVGSGFFSDPDVAADENANSP